MKRLALAFRAIATLVAASGSAHGGDPATCAPECAAQSAASPPSGAQAAEPPGPDAGSHAARLAARRRLRFELSAFPQYIGVYTTYPGATLDRLDRHVETAALKSGPHSSGWALGVGARFHHLDRLGFQTRLILGFHQVYAGPSDKIITMASSLLELMPVLGPWGRFYAGPVVFGGTLLFDGRAFLYREEGSESRVLGLFVYGLGSELGLHLGPREEVAVLVKVLVGDVANPPVPLSVKSSLFEAAVGASIAF